MPEAPTSLPARCLNCSYVLDFLAPAGKCPECGAAYDLGDSRTFTRSPPFDRVAFWLPGVLMALGITFLCLAVIGVGLGNNGWAMWIGVPISGGSLLGFRFRLGPATGIMAGLVMAAVIIGGAVSVNLAGMFCAMVLGAVIVLPIFLGIILGTFLRTGLKDSRWSQRKYLPVLLFAILPIVWALLEGRPVASVESVSTSMDMAASPHECFESLAFYEEVKHKPPLILRIGLSHPLGAIGSSRRINDIKKCLYNKGSITKRVTQVEPDRLLAFEVIDQNIGYERDVRLKGGSFAFEPMPGGGTRVTLTTTYVPLLEPRLVWRWGEHFAVHTLHAHVLEGLSRKARGEQGGAS